MTPITEEFFRRSAEIVREHHGIVDHFLSDVMMALFNVPIKHDDEIPLTRYSTRTASGLRVPSAVTSLAAFPCSREAMLILSPTIV